MQILRKDLPEFLFYLYEFKMYDIVYLNIKHLPSLLMYTCILVYFMTLAWGFLSSHSCLNIKFDEKLI